MDYLIVVLVLVSAVILVTALSPRVGVSAPLLLVLVGLGLSVIPAVPPIEIDPEWILAGVLPPLLYSASVNMPTMDFRRDLTTISGLSVALVVVSAVVLGVAFSWLVPGIGLSTGIALGAIVSPTDAVATSIVRKLGVSPRVVTVLEGESLLNDASALVLLRSAIAATAASVSLWHVAGDFLYAVAVAVAIGYAVGRLGMAVRGRIADPSLTTAVSFVVPFAAYLPAERLGASGLVATVAAGLVTGYGSARRLRPADRMSETSNWRTIEVILEGAVFLIMGLEVWGLIQDVRDEHGSLWTALGLGALTIAATLAIRAAYLAVLLLGLRRRSRRYAQGRDRFAALTPDDFLARAGEARAHKADREQLRRRLTRRLADIDYLLDEPLRAPEGAVLVWAGMRGVVTVAAAQTLPAETPQRSLLVLVAFVVAAGSLLVQGGTLPRVVRALGLARSGQVRTDMGPILAELDRAASSVVDESPRRANGEPYDEAVLARARESIINDQSEIADSEGDEDDDDSEDDGGSDGDVGGGGGVDGDDEDVNPTDPRDPLASGRARREWLQYLEIRVAVIEAQREALLRLRSEGTVSSASLSGALRILDAEQVSTELRRRA